MEVKAYCVFERFCAFHPLSPSGGRDSSNFLPPQKIQIFIFPLVPLKGTNNIRLFRLWWPRDKQEHFYLCFWRMFCVLTMLEQCVAFEFFNAMAKKMVELDLGGLLEESLIYLKHYSKIDKCCLIAFMLNFTPCWILSS